MADNSHSTGWIKPLVLSSAGIGLIFATVHFRNRILTELEIWLARRNPLRHKKIEIIDSIEDCQRVVQQLKTHCMEFKVLGFDCEWVTVNGTRRPTALLQLASHQGLCALFRLCTMKQIPKSLRELLEDDDVIKVGVGPQDDAQKLSNDYGVGVSNTLDLRYMASLAGYKPVGLAKLSMAHLQFHLDKNFRISCSDWEAKILNLKQIHYAANDALVAVEIFKKLWDEIEPRNFWQFKRDLSQFQHHLGFFLDVHYKCTFMNGYNESKVKSSSTNNKNKQSDKMHVRQMSTTSIRSRALYDNYVLQAPDGELLCNIDRKKANWYLKQNLAEQVSSDPVTIRLNFEPSGRAVGEVGRFYQTPKENQCVVCGRRDAYIRKNIVPREYRKFFPLIMKSHSSHDILLLCPTCHQLSNLSDLSVRRRLAHLCDAPLPGDANVNKLIDIPELKKVRSATRALLNHGDKIPQEKRTELEATVRAFFGEDKEITMELLEEGASMETQHENDTYSQHGLRVVQKFEAEFGGLIELEKLWRTHFLQTMQPKFLPDLWTVDHNASRLEIRAKEGRIDEEDLKAAGLKTILLPSCNFKLTNNPSSDGLNQYHECKDKSVDDDSKYL